jgi:hypothetical protein
MRVAAMSETVAHIEYLIERGDLRLLPDNRVRRAG